MIKKSSFTTVLLFVIFLAGISLLLYPTISDYWNSLHQSRAISSYTEEVAQLDPDKCEEVLDAAVAYNISLLRRPISYFMDEEQVNDYRRQLDITGTGIMGYVEIPAINCSLPIYHGTEETVLQTAVGHLEWTSLPVGGTNTHSVLSGHRGLPSAKLFTNLDQLTEGDFFILRVMNNVLTYEVDRILIVEPSDTKDLQIVPGEDLCTLITCTPYGINSHRLLVRGHRIENPESAAAVHIVADAIQVDPNVVAPIIAVPMLIVLLSVVLYRTRKRARKEWFI